MRTTIRLNDDLLREAKQVAARTGRTLTGVIEEALRDMLRRHDVRPRPRHLKLPTFRGQGLHPGVDLDDSAALLDVMEESRDPA